jgi:hypothetical protein
LKFLVERFDEAKLPRNGITDVTESAFIVTKMREGEAICGREKSLSLGMAPRTFDNKCYRAAGARGSTFGKNKKYESSSHV